jgi:hypothetical protein
MTAMIRNAHANLLCIKAQEDEAALAFPLSDHIFGFHAQQSCEKLLKALLSSRTVAYPKTHSIEQLADLLTLSNEILPILPYDLLDLEPFAVELRYDTGGSLQEGERIVSRQSVATLREHVIARILEIESASQPE